MVRVLDKYNRSTMQEWFDKQKGHRLSDFLQLKSVNDITKAHLEQIESLGNTQEIKNDD